MLWEAPDLSPGLAPTSASAPGTGIAMSLSGIDFPGVAVIASADLPDGRRISELLADFRHGLTAETVSFADAVAALGDRTAGTLLLLLAIPTVMPIPLGVSVLFNLPVLVFSAQLMLAGPGRPLPDWMLRRSITVGAASLMIDRILPTLRWIERMLKPRWPWLLSRWFCRWLGTVCFVMAFIAILPVPLIGWLPGFGLIIVALGLIEHDGAAVALGLGFGAAAVVFGMILVSGLSYAGTLLLQLPFPGG
jgi:hypothetical protein